MTTKENLWHFFMNVAGCVCVCARVCTESALNENCVYINDLLAFSWAR